MHRLLTVVGRNDAVENTVENISGYVQLRLARTCTPKLYKAIDLVNWRIAFETPMAWVSDNGAYFKNRVIRNATQALNVTPQFSVTDIAWTDGAIENSMHEVTRMVKSTLDERWCLLSKQIVVLTEIQ